MTTKHVLRALALAVPALACHSPLVQAQAQSQRVVANPPLLELQFRPAPGEPLTPLRAAAPGAPVAAHEASLDLNVVYTNGRIWNPAEGRYDAVKLRSYQGMRVDPNAPFVSGTNMHSHGLWVNPAGNGDNVLISVNPGVSFQYEYNVPSDHPAGTFWYHTHRHGSTALQVSSGMAGALIIRGNRPPTPTATGDLDTLLKPTRTQVFKERVLVLQQIQYACRDAQGKVKVNADGTYRCDPGDVGGIESYDQFGPGSWPASGRYTSINGLILPTFDGASAGQVERWRVIHGGVRDTVNLEFRKLRDAARSPERLRAAEQDTFVADSCTGDPLPQHLVAADGLTMAAALKSMQTVYQPAYRWDTLMVFPQPGVYCVIDAAAAPAASVNQAPPSRQLLGLVTVAGGRPVQGDITKYLEAELAAAAAVNMPAAVRNKVVADLRAGLKLASFVPHPDIADNEVTGTQQLAFNIDISKTPAVFEVNGQPYDPNRMDRVLMLGGVDEWTLKSDFVSHPFHIHVNPFQIVKILDPSGKDVSAPGAVDNASGTVDPQYPGLKGVWKDTLWLKNFGGKPPGQYTLIVRTRYQRYIGAYVLHCHILDHEDQGMMQNVSVALPDGKGSVSVGHH